MQLVTILQQTLGIRDAREIRGGEREICVRKRERERQIEIDEFVQFNHFR